MNEQLLHYIWQYQLFNKDNLYTHTGKKVTVIKTGTYNTNAGPDFFNARITIDKIELVGNIELHIKSSDFIKHNHQHDKNYKTIILHVVYDLDKTIDKQLENVETLALKNYINNNVLTKYASLMKQDSLLCKQNIASIDKHYFGMYLESLYIDRIQIKVNEVLDDLTLNKNDWEKTCTNFLFKNICAPINSEPAYLLINSIDFALIKKYSNNLLHLEALLFGTAGFLQGNIKDAYHQELVTTYNYLKHVHQIKENEHLVWKFLRMRPASFPTLRIAQLAGMLHKQQHLFSMLIDIQTLPGIYKLLEIEPSAYWLTHYSFNKQSTLKQKGLGKTTIDVLIINTLAPLLFAYSNYTQDDKFKQRAFYFLQELKAEKNRIVNLFSTASAAPLNALQSQAMIHLYKTKCLNKQCLSCSIGLKLLQ